MNLDLDAGVYDKETQCLNLKANTAVFSDDQVSIWDTPDETTWTIRWSSTSTVIHWDVKFANVGQLDIAMHLGNDEVDVGSEIEIEVDGQKVSAVTSFTGGLDNPTTIELGSVLVKKTGRLKVKMQAKSIKDEQVGMFWYLRLSGPAAVDSSEDMVHHSINDVQLCWHTNDQFDILYSAVTPTESYLGTAFSGVAFDNGYLVLQDKNYDGIQSVIWDFWPMDDDCGVIDVYTVPDMNEFVYEFSWNIGETYHFIAKATRLADDNSVLIAGYVYLKSESKWKFLVARKFSNCTRLMEGPRSFVRWFYGEQMGYYPREAGFDSVWGRLPNGDWKEITTCDFSQLGTLTNTDASVKDKRIHLRTGGRTQQTNKLGTVFQLPERGKLPQILEDIDSKLESVPSNQ